jgi:hypothetical protein
MREGAIYVFLWYCSFNYSIYFKILIIREDGGENINRELGCQHTYTHTHTHTYTHTHSTTRL